MSSDVSLNADQHGTHQPSYLMTDITTEGQQSLARSQGGMVRQSMAGSFSQNFSGNNNTNRSSERTTKTGLKPRPSKNPPTTGSQHLSNNTWRGKGGPGRKAKAAHKQRKANAKNANKSAESVGSNGPSLTDQMTSFQPSNINQIRDATQATQEDDTIVSNCGDLEHETAEFSTSPITSLGTSETGILTVQRPPVDFDHFVTWFDGQFGSLVTIPWQSISSFFNEHAKCTTYDKLAELLNYMPNEWFDLLGHRLYDTYRQFIYDLRLIFQWIYKMDQTCPNSPWEYATLLNMRHEVKETVAPLSSASDLQEQQARAKQQQQKPPCYQNRPDFETLLQAPPCMPDMTENQTPGSYHATSPSQVDDTGVPLTTQNFNMSTWSRYHARVKRVQQRSQHSYRKAFNNSSQHQHSTRSNGSQRSQTSNRSTHSMSNRSDYGEREASTRSRSNAHRRTELYRRYDAPAKTQPTFSPKHQWNGTSTTYDPYRKLILAHIYQAGAGYLVNVHFTESYSALRGEYLAMDDFWNNYQVSLKQAQYDRQWLYGMILGSNKDRENKFLLQYQPNSDGILTWIDFEKEYKNDGIGELKKYALDEQIGKSYKENYPGGLHKYLDDYEVAIEHYNVLDPQDSYSSTKAKDKLLMNLVYVTAITHLLQVCRDHKDWSLKQTVTYIKQNSHLIKDHNLTPSLRRKERTRSHAPTQEPPASAMLKATTMVDDATEATACTSQTDWLEEDSARTLLHTMADATSYVHVYNVMQNRPFRDNLHIPTEIWRRLEPEFQTRIREIRNEVNRSNRPSVPPTRPQAPSIPDQYPKTETTKVTHVQGGQDDDDYSYYSDSTDEDMYRLQYHVGTTRGEDENNANNDLQVRAHLEYGSAFNATANPSVTPKVYAISDGGADSTVLGQHAHVINQTGRYATLVGYDLENTRSGRIPIVSAYLKVKAHNGIPVFLKINEAVYNKNSPITLLSEYQIRDHGYVIDSVATKHLRGRGERGTQ